MVCVMCCMLFANCSMLSGVHCLMYGMRCMLYVDNRISSVVYWMLYIV